MVKFEYDCTATGAKKVVIAEGTNGFVGYSKSGEPIYTHATWSKPVGGGVTINEPPYLNIYFFFFLGGGGIILLNLSISPVRKL